MPHSLAQIAELGHTSDDQFNLVQALWALASLKDDNTDRVTRAQRVLDDLQSRLKTTGDTPADWLASIMHTVHGTAGFTQAPAAEFTDFAEFLLTQHGPPAAYAVLYNVLARTQGWDIQAVNFPGHLIVQAGQGNGKILCDPCNGRILVAHDLKEMLEEHLGVKAPLQHNYYTPLSDRDLVVRYYNLHKNAAVSSGDFTAALSDIETLLLLAPQEPRLYYDAATIAMRLDQIKKAIGYWQFFVDLATDQAERDEAHAILAQLKARLH